MNIYVKSTSENKEIVDCSAKYDFAIDLFSMYGRTDSKEENQFSVGIKFCNKQGGVIYAIRAGKMGKDVFYLKLLNFSNRVNIEELYYIEPFVFRE